MKLLPKQKEATLITLKAIQGLNNVAFLLYGGAIRGGKTYWALITALMLCEIYPKSRWGVIRKDLQRIRGNTIPSFKKLLDENPYIQGSMRYSPDINYTHSNGSQILFRGENIDRDPDLDRYKGFEVNGFIFEEINESSEKMFWKAFERAGSWIIPGMKTQPYPFVMGTCNPTQGWVKELVYDPYEAGTLKKQWHYIPAKITDNTELPDSYIQSLKNLPRYEYEVFVEGNWNITLKTGGEFLKEFEIEKHIKPIFYDPDGIIHVSIDSNVLPYIAISLWQSIKTGKGWRVEKFHELPAEFPHNSARKSALLLAKYLKDLNYTKKIFLYGDATTTARNNIDDENRSFLTLFTDSLTKKDVRYEKRFFNRNPIVSSTGEFMNAIFEKNIYNLDIIIGENCKKTISDYIEIKEDKDGSMAKTRAKDPNTGVSFEQYGHFLDTDRYFICKIFEDEFKRFMKRMTDYSEVIKMKSADSFIQGGI